jgi:thymidylate synthase ThyX
MAQVFLYDEFNPEDTAMLQALYSRSPESVAKHVEKVRQTGSGKFMETFYVGYGHSSIADCGSTTLFIEGLSILADKALQDWPLYCGQETSTRYVDMAKQPIIDPLNTEQSQKIINDWMDFYKSAMEPVKEHLRCHYPCQADQEDKVYQRAINARAFDILRSFLPAGITTQLSWHTNLRQAYDKLTWLRQYPLVEVRQIADQLEQTLKKHYPHSFCQTIDDQQENYRQNILNDDYYYKTDQPNEFSFSTNIKDDELNQQTRAITNRPPKTSLPYFLAELGSCTFEFLLDYGSFRDIQRHRNGVCRMPLLTARHGFHSWYLEQLPTDLRQQALDLIAKQIQAVAALPTNEATQQYYLALGFLVPCKVTYGLPASVYTAELRSNQTVHPTLRQVAHQMIKALQERWPKLQLHADLSPSVWDINRGKQTIEEKTNC